MQRVDEDVQVRVIVADDCSKDGTLEIIKSCEEKSPFPIGIFASGAKYVAMCEGDDY